MKCHHPAVSGRSVLPGSHPVPADHFLAGNGVWFRDRAAEEDTVIPVDGTPQFSTVFPADKRLLTSRGQLQQGEPPRGPADICV